MNTEQAERDRIRAEEAARIEREQAAAMAKKEEMAAAQRALDAVAEAKRVGAMDQELADGLTGLVTSLAADSVIEAAAYTPPGTQGAPAAPAREMLSGAVLALRGAAQPDTPPTLTVGKINERLGFVLTSAFIVQTLRIAPAALSNQKTPLWHDSALPHICVNLAEHVLTIGGAA